MTMERWMVIPILLLLVLNIAAPTVDVGTDILLVIQLVMRGHVYTAMAMLTPLVANFVFTLIAFITHEEEKRKWYTWMFLILQCWPQYRASKIIAMIWRNDSNWERSKDHMERNIGSLEPFVESVMQCITQSIIWELDSWEINPDCRRFTWTFLTSATLLTSYTSAFIGLMKFLKIGPSSFLYPGGPIAGFCTGRYFLTFISVSSTIYFKLNILGLTLLWFTFPNLGAFSNLRSEGKCLVSTYLFRAHFAQSIAYSFSIIYVPHFLLNLAVLFLSLKSKFLPVLSKYPQYLLTPTLTMFAFGTLNTRSLCSSGNVRRLAPSKTFTWINMTLHIGVAAAILGLSTYQSDLTNGWRTSMRHEVIIPIAVTSTILILHLDSCCPDCRCSSCCPVTQISVLDSDHIDKQFILMDGKVVLYEDTQVLLPTNIEMLPNIGSEKGEINSALDAEETTLELTTGDIHVQSVAIVGEVALDNQAQTTSAMVPNDDSEVGETHMEK